jgi:hypothetical protein
VQYIRKDLHSPHHQLQPKVIKLARITLLATNDIHIKLKKLGIMEQRDSNCDPLHGPKSTQSNRTYTIQEEHKNEEHMLDQNAKIERIARTASIHLDLATEDGVRMEIQHMWNGRLGKIIEQIITLAKYITALISRNEKTEEAWIREPEAMKPFYCIVHFSGNTGKQNNDDFLQCYITENETIVVIHLSE